MVYDRGFSGDKITRRVLTIALSSINHCARRGIITSLN